MKLTPGHSVHIQECVRGKAAKLGCVWLLAASLLGCADNNRSNNCVSVSEAVPLACETVETEVAALVPRGMFVVDGKLGIYKDREEYLFDFYTLPDFKYLCSTGHKGQGPDDFLGLESRNFEVSDTTFSALEHMTWRVKTMTLVGDSAVQVIGTSGPLEATGAINLFHRLDSLHYLSIGATTNQKEFCIYDLSDGSAHEMGEYPQWVDTETEGVPLFLSYGKSLAVSPDGNKFVAFYWYFDRVRFFDRDCRELMSVTVEHEIGEKQEQYGGLLPAKCYSGVKAAGDKIYALHADCDSTRLLEVWDWNGRLISVYRLDRPVLVMTIDVEGRRLIAKDAEHCNEIYLYELPDYD